MLLNSLRLKYGVGQLFGPRTITTQNHYFLLAEGRINDTKFDKNQYMGSKAIKNQAPNINAVLTYAYSQGDSK